MLRTLLAGVFAVGGWLAWELLGDGIGEAFAFALRPVRRRLWSAIVEARSPWPLILMLLLGVFSTLLGFLLLRYPDWRGGTGVLLFVGGAALAFVAPFLWRDARRQAARAAEPTSRPDR